MAFSADERGLYVAGNRSEGQVIWFDLGGVEKKAQSIVGSVWDIIVGPEALFLIGNTIDATWVEKRNLATLDLLARQTLPPIGRPAGHLGNSGRLYIGGYTANTRDNAALYVIDGNTADLAVLEDQARNLLFDGAIGAFWVSEEEGRIFVSDAETARLWAINADGQVETSIGHNTQQKGDAVSFSIDVSVKNEPRCMAVLENLPNQPSRFMIVDYLLGSVNSAVYSRSFGVFDIISETATRLKKLSGARLETYAGSATVLPPMLISSSCDNSTVLVASPYSDQLVQYAHQVGSNAFELVNKIALRAGQPIGAVAASDQGNWGAVALADSGTVILLSGDLDDQKAATPEAELTNRAIQRHLLLVGYRIGAIDGILGGKTKAAMDAFAQKHDLEADPSTPAAFLQEMLNVIEIKGLD